MALNPDALNLNYDSDDSMQVDSDSDHPQHFPPSILPIPDPDADADADADADPDADAEGDAEYVDDTASAILENPVAGPSSYSHKPYVRPLFPTPVRANPPRFPQGRRRLGMSPFRSYLLISLNPYHLQGYEDEEDEEDDVSYADDEYGKKKASRKKKKKAPPASSAPRPKGSYVPCLSAAPIDDRPKQLYVTLHQIQTQIMVRDQRKRRNLACPATRYVSPVGETRSRTTTRITRTLPCSPRRLLRHITSTPR